MPFELISYGTGDDWIGKLWSKFKSVRAKYQQELNEINNIMFVDPEEIARYYVEPNCQEINPADHHEERFLTATEPVMRKIDQFFKAKVFQPGDKHLFILSDAGMGKSSLLIMIKLMHLTSFWISDKKCVLKKLGITTLEEIADIREPQETILLLDSLDEDPTAYGRVRERLEEIFEATRLFFRVILTCRTQFFPHDPKEDPFRQPGMAILSGFRCPVKYLSFFDDALVTKYLSKRFPRKFGIFKDSKKIRQARQVIEKMGSLRCRPMLLSYIEDLMASPLLGKEDSEYRIYDLLIRSWLNREKSKHPDISEENLLDAGIILAVFLYIRGKREISRQDLDKLIAVISKVKPIIGIDLKGRSLLNRNSEGGYRFSHYSIQEFLVAKLLLSDKPIFHPKQMIPLTDFIFRMILMSAKAPKFMNLLDFKGLKLSKTNLRGAKLPGADMKGLDLSGSDIRDADLSGADLSNVNFTEARLDGTMLERAKLYGAYIENIFGVRFVCITPGEFMMGSPREELGRFDNEVLHKVTLTKLFWIQTTPVTQKQWKAVMGKNPSRFIKHGEEDRPVENVSYNDVQEFIKRYNRKEGTDKYRLPTEAEWEYACRAGSDTAYCFGNDEKELKEYGWCVINSDNQTHPVGKLRANAWGLLDMHGNVWEWCADWYGDYPTSEVSDPEGPETGLYKVLRGGCWNIAARLCRSAYRARNSPDNRFGSHGFRLVRDV